MERRPLLEKWVSRKLCGWKQIGARTEARELSVHLSICRRTECIAGETGRRQGRVASKKSEGGTAARRAWHLPSSH